MSLGRLTRTLAATPLLTLAALSLSGCAVGPDFTPPAAPEVTRYTQDQDPLATAEADGIAQRFTPSASLPADWWHLFNAPQIDAAVRQGLAASPTMALAEANLNGAENALRAGEGVFFPHVSAGYDGARERPAGKATGAFNLFTLSTTISYTLDIFGGQRRAVEALGATVDYQRNLARAASLTLATNIANTMIAIAAYDAEIQATEDIIALQRNQLGLAKIQAESGTLSYAGVLTLQATLDASEGALPPLRQKRVQAYDLLAMLLGRFPAETPPPQIGFADLSLPPSLPLSLPAALVHQRPDILQAEAMLHAASAEIGVTTAAMLPSITLDGTFGFSNTTNAGLLSSGNKFWSLGGGLVTPIFQGGTLWFQRKAAINAYEAAAATYRQTVLVAFQQVSDTILALDHDAELLAIESRALQSSARALSLVQANYQAGLVPYSDVLIADNLNSQARIGEIAARATRYQDTVALFAALGGGWWSQ